jgi:hypothetical protein
VEIGFGPLGANSLIRQGIQRYHGNRLCNSLVVKFALPAPSQAHDRCSNLSMTETCSFVGRTLRALLLLSSLHWIQRYRKMNREQAGQVFCFDVFAFHCLCASWNGLGFLVQLPVSLRSSDEVVAVHKGISLQGPGFSPRNGFRKEFPDLILELPRISKQACHPPRSVAEIEYQ